MKVTDKSPPERTFVVKRFHFIQSFSISSNDLFFVSGQIVTTNKKQRILMTANIQKVYASPNPLIIIGTNWPIAQLAPHKNIVAIPAARARRWFGKISEIMIHVIGPTDTQKAATNPNMMTTKAGPLAS